jgi:rhodanese-related sulfurtransferase
MNFDKIYIDIRDEHELLEKYIVSTNEKVFVISMTMRVIFANIAWIQRQKCDVVIVCRSGNRAQHIKNEYFTNNTNVIVLDGGINGLDKIKPDNLKIVNGLGGFGQQQYLQLMFAVILTLILVLCIFQYMYLTLTASGIFLYLSLKIKYFLILQVLNKKIVI